MVGIVQSSSAFVLGPSSFSGSLLWAAEAFPRGPGFYFNPVKLLLVVAVYLAWVRTCWWVDEDCREVGMPTVRWNPAMLACGCAGLLLVWGLPVFWASFLGLVTLYLSPTLLYVAARNEKVPEEDKVLTAAHLSELSKRYLSMQFGRKARAEEKQKIIPIRFIGKSGNTARPDDAARVRRAQESPSYREALEMVYRALQMRATDIHMEPTREEMTVRLRIDGMLQPAKSFERHEGDSILNIFKVLAALDITEKRVSQDGSFSAEVITPVEEKPGKKPRSVFADDEDEQAAAPKTVLRQVDFRVATAGSVAGEKMVMRLLDRSRSINDLSRLGMRERMRDQIRLLVTQPHGMFIVCGPTGAGKSTTLYACLSEIDRFQKNVITVENPVEYHIDNVTQIEINPKAGKTFASELRSILRQDPDVIYIGEVRDHETAEIACQAAQTGHMVFTTLHANDTMTALGRLLELGVKPFMVASSVSGILGQRLVRLLCPRCKVSYRPNPEMLRRANLPAERIKFFFRAPKTAEGIQGEEGPEPCPHCNGTGYRGRTGIFELLVINEKIREMIKDNPNFDAIRQEAMKSGTVLLSQDGMRIVVGGETSIEELLRVSK
jgi:type II secretory ATPase GspE/PulE/Tfp pilus assembly ATPase PilB-like protein